MKERLYNELAKYYDLFNYSDYGKQSMFLSKIFDKYSKDCLNNRQVLDLACGTGEHIKLLKDKFIISGQDINWGMIKVARAKNKKIKIAQGDLNKLKIKTNFYGLIYCFSSSIQYILNPADLLKTFLAINKGLSAGGIFAFDLSYCKENWKEGYVGISTVIKDDLQIVEIFKSRSKNNISYYNPVYLINEKNKFKFYIDEHQIYLYKINQIKKLLKIAGFKKVLVKADYEDKNLILKKKQTPIFLAIK